MNDPLLVFALKAESGDLFNTNRIVYTGVGKVQAAYALTHALMERRPACVINLGSAGSAVHAAGSVVCCTTFVQRDMDVRALGFAPYATPFCITPPLLRYGHAIEGFTDVVCGTGDTFETAHAEEGTITYNIVDMEAYALALVCQRQNVPFICLKYISDGADGKAAQTWEDALADGARKLHTALERALKGMP